MKTTVKRFYDAEDGSELGYAKGYRGHWVLQPMPRGDEFEPWDDRDDPGARARARVAARNHLCNLGLGAARNLTEAETILRSYRHHRGT